MSERRTIVAVAQEGDPLYAFIKRPGCWDRVQAFVGRWLVRGLLVGVGMVIGVVVE